MLPRTSTPGRFGQVCDEQTIKFDMPLHRMADTDIKRNRGRRKKEFLPVLCTPVTIANYEAI